MPESGFIEPLHLHGLADYHVHCDYSIDATGTIEEYCRAALNRGLAEICFTTHYDANPSSDGRANFVRIEGRDEPTTIDRLAPYVEEVLASREQFMPLGLSVKPGLEFGWYPGCESHAEEVLRRYGFEHFLCGIHEIDNICFCCRENYTQCFERYTAEETARKYADEIIAASNSGLFTAIAHLDYVRKYGLEHYGDALDEALLVQAQERFFPTLTKNGTPIEINTSAMRRGLNDYFPRVKLANAARRAGVDVKFLGSDAHTPEQVGFDFDTAAPLASMTAVHCDTD